MPYAKLRGEAELAVISLCLYLLIISAPIQSCRLLNSAPWVSRLYFVYERLVKSKSSGGIASDPKFE